MTGVQTCALPILAAAEQDRGLLFPAGSGSEAAWVDATRVTAAKTLGDVVRHYTGQVPLEPAKAGQIEIGRASCRERV